MALLRPAGAGDARTDQRARYLAALRAADRGDHTALIGFFRDVTIDAIELVVQALRTARSSGALDLLASLGEEDEESPPDESRLHFLASRLQAAVHDELHEVASHLGEEVMAVRITADGPGGASADAAPGWPSMNVVATSQRHAASSATAAATVGVMPEPSGHWPLQVVAESPDHRARVAPMRVRLGNLYPTLTTVTQQRIREWARQVVNVLAAELAGRPVDQGQMHPS